MSSPSDEKSYAPSGFSTQSPTRSTSFSDTNSTHDSRSETEPQEPKLPFSKGRAIALVLTLTGAAFLNVSARLMITLIGAKLTMTVY